jgi:hypothetical protein
MPDQTDGAERGSGGGYAYFMVRIHGSDAVGQVSPSGMVERLGSGRKQSFSGLSELIHLLTEMPEPDHQDAPRDRPRQ